MYRMKRKLLLRKGKGDDLLKGYFIVFLWNVIELIIGIVSKIYIEFFS